MVFSFLTQELAIDLGTANTVIFMNDKKIIDEPSIVAIDNLTGKVLAVGTKAKQMQGKESKGVRTIRPLKEGVIADFDSSEQMIRAFIKMINTRRSFFSPSLEDGSLYPFRQYARGNACGKGCCRTFGRTRRISYIRTYGSRT